MTTETTTTETTTEKPVTETTATIVSTGTGADTSGTTAETTTTETNTETAADWRVKLAGDDKDFAKQLGRYSDEASFGKAYRALQTKLSSGEFKKALPEGASAEELATWRKENGLPEKAEDYFGKLELPKGMVIGEADKPIIAEFAAAALAGNVDPKQLSGMVGKYYEILDGQRAKQEDADVAFKTESEEALRLDWQGADFRRNLTAVNNLIATWPEGLASKVLAGRDAEGRKLGDNPAFIKQLAALAVELNPHSTLVPAGTTDPAKSVAEELESIRELRRNKPDEYNAGIKKFEARELELIDAQLKMKKRAA